MFPRAAATQLRAPPGAVQFAPAVWMFCEHVALVTPVHKLPHGVKLQPAFWKFCSAVLADAVLLLSAFTGTGQPQLSGKTESFEHCFVPEPMSQARASVS